MVTPVPNGQQINILDLYESLSSVSKIAAIMHHTCSELRETHRPDNGFIAATMDLKAMEFLLAELKGVIAEQLNGDRIGSSRDIDSIADSSIIGNPEKMMFYTKELAASCEDPKYVQNPIVLTKLNIDSINNYDFDKHQGTTFKKKLVDTSIRSESQASVKDESKPSQAKKASKK